MFFTPDLTIIKATYEHLTKDSPKEAIVEVLGLLDDLARDIKSFKEEVADDLKERIKADGKAFEFGDWLYIVGKKKTEKCKGVKDCITAILELSGGDWGAVEDCLSSNALKVGAVRKVLADQFDMHYTTTFGEELELKPINKRFLK